ncbi:acyl carrier protein [Mangrovihabitans endophyticus]|uniref:Carrier domain-containing protein n=1 Tax=Mangrovihabitans endophyticus TaxID=1751298 RepID=A0A8J3C2W0_9ACTN|nr:acyl carrier protein [Mangrovihabitans endophyticus]GGL09656.1 hypothetical protein GCM10012284_50410 [Mangrovihabitans endophyticus]
MTTSSDRTAPDAVQTDLVQFLTRRTGKDWTADDDVFGSGGLSSLHAMELVVHLERTFGVSIRGGDLQKENFRTVQRMSELVERLQTAGDGGTGA